MFTMLTSQRKVRALVFTAFLVGALAFTVMVFAGGEAQEHNQSNSHVHTKNGVRLIIQGQRE